MSAKNITPSFCLSSTAAASTFFGTMPSSIFMKSSCWPVAAISPAFCAPCAIAWSSMPRSSPWPGAMRFTITRPMATAMSVTTAV